MKDSITSKKDMCIFMIQGSNVRGCIYMGKNKNIKGFPIKRKDILLLNEDNEIIALPFGRDIIKNDDSTVTIQYNIINFIADKSPKLISFTNSTEYIELSSKYKLKYSDYKYILNLMK